MDNHKDWSKGMSKKEKKKGRMGGIIRNLVLIIAAAVFLFSAYQLVMIYLEYKKGTDEYDKIRQYAVESPVKEETKENDEAEGEEEGEEAQEVQEPQGPQIDFEALKAVNPDVVGWIEIETLDISYPIVQTTDNDHYLHYTFEGQRNANGAIFLEHTNSSDFEDCNTIIYGHHMDGGAMFGDFDRYLDPSFADSHLYGNIFANGKDYGLELFAFLELDAYNTGLYVTPVQEVSRKEQYLQEIEDTALWYRQISLSTEDRLVVMSTCTENITNGRHILIGKLSKQTYKDTYKKTLKRNSQIDRIDWGIFWKTSMKRLGVLILLLFSILLLMAVERSGKRKKTKNNSRKLEN